MKDMAYHRSKTKLTHDDFIALQIAIFVKRRASFLGNSRIRSGKL